MKTTLRMREKDVKRQVKDLLDACGIYHYPLTAGMGSHPGLPDRQAHHNGEIWQIEIKHPGGKLRPAQIQHQVMCENTGTRYIVAYSAQDVAEAMGLEVRF